MDHATVFADGFNDEVDGLPPRARAQWQGVVHQHSPLVAFEDKNGDGKADTKQSLASGFGVRVGFLGHDLHGLRQGPDGRIYFSIGDRAASVTTKDGRKLHTPEYGTIYRCEPDGSDLELYHIDYGIRRSWPLTRTATCLLATITPTVATPRAGSMPWKAATAAGALAGSFLREPVTTRRGPWLDERMCFPTARRLIAFRPWPISAMAHRG